MADAALERQSVIDDAVAAALFAFTNAQVATATGAGTTTNVTFALTPALANTGALDLSKPEGSKLFNKAAEKLTFTFEGKPDQVPQLRQAIRNRAKLYGFNRTIMTIPDDDGNGRSLITEHGMLSYEAVRNWAIANVVGQATRTAQDNEMLFQCLFNSVSEDVKKKLMPKTEETEVNEVGIAALLYKCIIATVEVETKATIANIRVNLINLKTKMKEMEFDISKFHQYVQQQLVSLASHGKTSEDLTVYLFLAYKSVPDEGFGKTIESKESEYLMGSIDLESKDLINFAQTCYDVRSTDTSNPWLQKSKDKVEFEALTANLNHLKSANEQLAKALTAKVANVTKKGAAFNPKTKSKANIGSFAWKDVAPKKDDRKTKGVNGKTHHWCHKHKAWTLHKPEECRLKEHVTHVSEKDNNSEEQDDEDDGITYDQSVLALATAFAMDS